MKKSEKEKILSGLLITFLLFIFPGCCVVDPTDEFHDNNHIARAQFSFEIDPGEKNRLRCEGISGEIEIIGVPDDSPVLIYGVREVGAESVTDAEHYLGELQVSVSELRDEVLVQTVQPEQTKGRSYVVHYHIRVPAQWVVEVENTNGEVSVENLDYLLTVDLVNGNVKTDDTRGNLNVSVTNGQIYSRAEIPYDGSCELKTVNGTVDLEIPQDTSARLSAVVTNGRVNVSNLSLEDAVNSRTSVRGTLGEGEGRINLRTTNGDIRVIGF
jgi:hypothetical protein